MFQFPLFQINHIEILDYQGGFKTEWVPQAVLITVFHRDDTDFYLFNNDNNKRHLGKEWTYYPSGKLTNIRQNI